MALSGLDIYKMLPGGQKPPHPKANCKECGYPTCLAFAMKLAAKQADLSACQYVSGELVAKLSDAAAPPIRLITLSSNGHKLEVGNETVLFRHEKTFFHKPGLFVKVNDGDGLEVSQQSRRRGRRLCRGLRRHGLEPRRHRRGLHLGQPGDVRRSGQSRLRRDQEAVDPHGRRSDRAQGGPGCCAGRTPLVYAADAENWRRVALAAKTAKAPLAVRVQDADLDALAKLTDEIAKFGVEDLVLDPGVRGFNESLAALTSIRRLALKENVRALGYPVITFPGEGATGPLDEIVLAGQQIAKYAGIVVLDHFTPASAYALLVLRENVYTDPQKPIQVEPGVYPINNPGPDAPLMVTTNFSITYFSVANEVESSGLPGWLLVTDAEGMSVLTAWAAGKFDAERIAKAVKESGAAGKINHRKVIIPGHVAVLMGELEEELPGWTIQVGPREAVDLPAFLKLV